MELVNLKELAKLGGVPETNLRRYLEHFPAYIPNTFVGKLKLYSTDSVPVIQFIAARYADKAPTDLIRADLEQKFGVRLEVEAEQERHATTPEMGLSTEVFGEVIKAVAQQGQMLQQMVMALDKGREIERLQDRIEQMEKEHNRKLDEVLRRLNEKKPWWRIWDKK